jgi:hypothetical protein
VKFCFEFEVKFEFFGWVGYDFFFRTILHTLPTIKRIALNDVMTVAKKKVERRQSTLMIEKVFPSPFQAQEGN